MNKRPKGDLENARRRLQTEVTPEPNSGCLIWLGAASSTGYGSIGIDGRRHNTHRLAWMFAHGPIPDGLLVLHKCDVRSCVNVNHLYLGTARQNLLDRYERNQSNQGERHSSAKLKESDVLKILKDERPYKFIATEYGVSESHISGLKTGKFWNNLRRKMTNA